MKKISIVIVCCLLSFTNFAQLQYTNPILAGFYPDPSICRVGDDYYIVNSSFSYFPGLPIFHSKDLVNWKQIGNAMDRVEQLDLRGAGVSRGLFAPTIRYHNGTYYIICTLIDKGGNFIITAKDPKGPWSNPVWLPKVDGIDPSLFFDDNNKAYILYNSIPPNNVSLHDGHRTIRMQEFDVAKMKAIGEEKIIINGGTDMAKKPVWIEGPHVFKKDGWYYLICAEGGTGYNHSEVVFRSKTMDGPFISYEKNPILTQRHLSRDRKDPITTTGHADFVETPDGKWYAVFLGCRPYEGDYYNIGRETFMTPVEWKDGWPTINPGFETVQYKYPVPMPGQTKLVYNNFSGNFYYKNDFINKTLDPRFVFLRDPEKNLYDLSSKKGFLSLPLKSSVVSGVENPAFVGFRQSNLKGYASTSLAFTAISPNEKAGLIIFQNEKHYYYLCKSIENNEAVVQLYKSQAKEGEKDELIVSKKLNSTKELQLKIEAKGDTYLFYYAEKNNSWILLKGEVNGKFLSTKEAGGFVGSVFGLYSTSTGKQSKNVARFNWFEYKGNDDEYK